MAQSCRELDTFAKDQSSTFSTNAGGSQVSVTRASVDPMHSSGLKSAHSHSCPHKISRELLDYACFPFYYHLTNINDLKTSSNMCKENGLLSQTMGATSCLL